MQAKERTNLRSESRERDQVRNKENQVKTNFWVGHLIKSISLYQVKSTDLIMSRNINFSQYKLKKIF